MIKSFYISLFFICISINLTIGQQAEIIKSLRIHTLEALGVQILGKNIIQNEQRDYYAILSSDQNDILIDDEVYPNNPLPPEYVSDDDLVNHILLIKINKDLVLQKVVKIKNVKHSSINIAVSGNHVVMGFEQRKHVLIGEKILPYFDSGAKYTLVTFDSDLENMSEINIPNLKTYIGKLTVNDEFLYLEARFNNGFQKFEYGNTSLVNFFTINESTLDTTFGIFTPFIVQYDLEKAEVRKAWKFGGLGEETIINMQLDKNENIVINGGIRTLKWVTFNELDTMNVNSYDTGYLVKYNSEGEVVFSNLFIDLNSAIAVQVYLDNSDSYVSFSYRGDSMIVAGTEVVNKIQDESSTASTSFVCKFDNDGKLEWAHSLNPTAGAYRNVNIVGGENTIIISGELTDDIEVDIKGEIYSSETRMNILYTLNKETGELISNVTSNADHIDVKLNCLSQDEDKNLTFLYQTVSEHDLWGNEFDTWYLGGSFDTRSIDQFFLKINPSFLTETDDLISTREMISVYPNLVHRNGFINIRLNEGDKGIWKLYSKSGQVVKYGNLINRDGTRIEISDLQSGQYVLHYNNGIEMQNEVIIIF